MSLSHNAKSPKIIGIIFLVINSFIILSFIPSIIIFLLHLNNFNNLYDVQYYFPCGSSSDFLLSLWMFFIGIMLINYKDKGRKYFSYIIPLYFINTTMTLLFSNNQRSMFTFLGSDMFLLLETISVVSFFIILLLFYYLLNTQKTRKNLIIEDKAMKADYKKTIFGTLFFILLATCLGNKYYIMIEQESIFLSEFMIQSHY